MPHDKDLTHWHEPSGNKKAGFGKFKKQPTPYDAFMESEGIPVFRDIGMTKVQNLPLVPVEAHRRQAATTSSSAAPKPSGAATWWRCRRPARSPEKHMYEEIYLVVEGRGTTEVWQEGDTKKHVFEWQKGSMFSIPMNAWFRIVNATIGGALLLAGTTAPNVLNMINNVDAVFNNPFVFRDRFNGADDFFKPQGRHRARPGARPGDAAHQLHPGRHQLRPAARQPPLGRLAPRRAVHDQQPVLFLDRPARDTAAIPRRMRTPRPRSSSA